jgi:hypothetical protein
LKAEIILADTATKSSPVQFVLLNKNYFLSLQELTKDEKRIK